MIDQIALKFLLISLDADEIYKVNCKIFFFFND